MELAQAARELGCWAADEMGVPAAARAPESTLRRLCLGQGAEIWAYILRHVHSQRYGHQDSPEVRRKSELEATVARLRAEIRELDQSLELMERENEAHEAAVEQAVQTVRDTQRRAVLLRAQAGAMRRQQRGLQDPMQRLQNQLSRLQDIERKGKVDVTFGPLTSASLGLEPVVLCDVRTVCTLRAQFLQNLLIPQAREGNTLTAHDDHFGTSYQQWLSSVETLLTNHPPGHVLAALEHLAAERESEIRSLCGGQGLGDVEVPRPQALDQSDSSQALPSMAQLIQEGWRTVGSLVSQRGTLLKERQVLRRRLQSLVEEVERHTLGSSERQALMLGLRSCGLWAELKALRAQSQELEEAAGRQQLLLRELQAKQQRILRWRRLVEETQQQIRLLIKGNSASKTRLCRSPGEVRWGWAGSEDGRVLEPLPTILPSIYQLHPASPQGSSLTALGHTLGLPRGKAAELLLPRAASLRQDLLFLQDQRSLRCWKTGLPPGPSTQELLQLQASQEKEQKETLGQALKRLEKLLKQGLERIPELQGAVGDWWEQPGQAALSEELRQGLSLPQWRLRWVQAQGALQQLCR
uniref:HAUS augmin like complex subunit 5 n=1 Tax=Oryctolagus cuniculus TaxID=9986 RepID=G1SEK7_RABIT